MSSHFQWETNGNSTPYQAPPRLSGLARHNLDNLREAALTVLKEVDSLTSNESLVSRKKCSVTKSN
jgi:hypothetical protein